MARDPNFKLRETKMAPVTPGASRRARSVSVWRAHRFAILLMTFLAVGGVLPVAQELRGGGQPVVAEAVFLVALVAAFYAASENKGRAIALTSMGLIGAAVQVFASTRGDVFLTVIGASLLLLFFVAVALVILRFVLTSEHVTTETIAAALCVYLFMGVIWALGYELAFTTDPTSFRSAPSSFWEFVYYSFATLTTLGYPEVVPSGRLSKSLSVIEAIAGQFYVAVLVSRMVGLHIAHAASAKAATTRRE